MTTDTQYPRNNAYKNALRKYRHLTGSGIATNSNSYTFMAGRFNAKKGLNVNELNNSKQWKRSTLSRQEYQELIKTYYPAHIRAMMEVESAGSDDNCSKVSRYEMVIPNHDNNLMFLEDKPYHCTIENVSLWFFPYGMVLFSIKVNDSGTNLNDLTMMHSKWKKWGDLYTTFNSLQLDRLLKPLTALTQDQLPNRLTHEGTKMRQYQVVQCDSNTINDNLLYEIGTFSSIGVVRDKDLKRSYKPSDEYYQAIMHDNTVSAFSNWKALALNDSFTVLAIDDTYARSEYDPAEKDGYRYFELLYMRCLFEEYYCFDRNNLFREQKSINVDKQLEEIKAMERNYFYDDLSYDFLPPLMLRAMEKGLGLPGDRKELTEHIKEAYQERQDKEEQMKRDQQEKYEQMMRDQQEREEREQQRRSDKIVGVVQLLAAFSILGTLYQLIIAMTECERSGWLAGILLAIGLAFFCYLLLKIIRGGKKNK